MARVTEILKSDSALVVLLGIITLAITVSGGATWWFAGEMGGTRSELSGMRKDLGLVDYRLGRIEERLSDTWSREKMRNFAVRLADLNPTVRVPMDDLK